MYNMNNVKSTILAAHNMTPVLQRQVDSYKRVNYRFFPIPKEVFNLAYSVQKGEPMKNDDWTNIHNQQNSWKEKGMVI